MKEEACHAHQFEALNEVISGVGCHDNIGELDPPLTPIPGLESHPTVSR